MRAAESLNPGSKYIINTHDIYDDDDGDGPFGLGGHLEVADPDHDEDESDEDSDDEPDELFVEDDDVVMEGTREVWKSLRTGPVRMTSGFPFV